MKPYEEDWANPEDFEVTVLGPELDRGVDAPRETLARSAPDMARELLGAVVLFRRGNRIGEAEIRGMERGLAKAGVLP